MKQDQYKDFSLELHRKKWRHGQINTCQFELTFNCPLHCSHCYTDCYNNPEDTKNELVTREILRILDKVYCCGVFWLCFTGGDPLARKDFLEIYTYAKKKGFIVTVFTSAVLITDQTADHFKKLTPFCIEVTLNGVTEKTYEAISGVKGSFESAMAGINRLKERKIPFKIKTMATKQNRAELDAIRNFVESLGLRFRPSTMLQARLNRDLEPCSLRLEPEEVLEVDEKFNASSMDEEERSLTVSRSPLSASNRACPTKPEGRRREPHTILFRCAAGGDTFHIDPYGKMFLCTSVRRPLIDLLENEIADGFKLFSEIKARLFETDSECKTCTISHLCHRCPGRAYLENGDDEAPIDYFCTLAHLAAERKNILCTRSSSR